LATILADAFDAFTKKFAAVTPVDKFNVAEDTLVALKDAVVNPVDKFNVAAVMFVETAFAENNEPVDTCVLTFKPHIVALAAAALKPPKTVKAPPTVTSVAFKFVIRALADVSPVDKLSVALVMFVETAFAENNEPVDTCVLTLNPHIVALAAAALKPPKTVKAPPTVTSVAFKFVSRALADVSPVDKLRVADVMLVDTAFVFKRVAIVAVVTLAFVICALAVVSPVDKLSVALVIFVEISFVLRRVAIVAVVTLAFVICALAVVSPVDKLSVALVMLVDTALTMLNVPPVKLVAVIVPLTSNAEEGLAVPMPTFPLVEIVILLVPVDPIASNVPLETPE